MAEERKPGISNELESSAIGKTELPIAQFISKIKSRIQVKLNSDERLLKLLSELEDNSKLLVEEHDLDVADKVALIEEGKKLSQELKQKIGELSRNVAAVLTTSFQGIENYYNQFLPVTTHYTNQSRELMDSKLGETALQEATVTQAQGGNLEAKLENTQQTVSIVTNNNIKNSTQSFFSVSDSKENAQRDKLYDEETVKQKLVNRIPTHFRLGAAIGKGDCFFDAMAQSLNALKGSNDYTAKSLRLLCDDYVKSEKHSWVKEAIEQDKDSYEQYLVRIRFTVEELAEEEKANTGLKLEDIIWGRPEIEGRMICEITKIKLHVIGVLAQSINGIEVTEQVVDPQASEPITTIEKGQYDSADIVRLVNYHNHFVPLLDNKLLQAEKPLTQLAEYSPIYSSPNNTNIPVTAPYSQHSFNANLTTAGKTPLEVKNRRTGVSIPSRLAKGEFADVIKEKIKQGANANSQYQSLLEKLVDPRYQEHIEFLKEEMRHIRKGTSNNDFQAYLTWLENNYAKIGHRETSGKFEEEAIDLYIREEREVQIKRWNVPNIPSHFIGRKSLLEQLAQRLNPKESQTATVILTALHGLGGVGKTFLAARYAQLYAENYTFVLWFNAKSETTLMNDYHSFADTFHLPIEGESPESTLTIVKNWLEQQSNWLIIYDNAPNDQLIAKYRPAKGGKVLITSRKESWNKKDSLPIDVFSLKEARAYIVELTGFSLDEHQNKIDELAKTLGNLPLALAQACAYIAVKHLSLEEYLALYAGSRAEMLADKTMPAETSHEPVAVTWHITFEAIKKQQPAASTLLESCAFLEGSHIPEFLLKDIFAKQQPELANQAKPFIDAMGCLKQYSMLKSIGQAKETTYSIHNLVQGAIFLTLVESTKVNYHALITQVLNKYEYDENFHQKSNLFFSAITHISKIVEQIRFSNSENETLKCLSELHIKLGKFYLFERNNFIKSKDNLRKAKEMIEKNKILLPIDKKAILYCFLMLSTSLIGNNENEDDLMKLSFYIISQRLIIEENSESYDAYADGVTSWFLAEFCKLNGNYTAAEEYINKAITIFNKLYKSIENSEGLVIANMYRTLAEVYKHQNKLIEAKNAIDDSLKIFEKLNPTKSHPLIALVYHEKAEINLFKIEAILEKKQKNYNKIELYFNKAEDDLNSAIDIRNKLPKEQNEPDLVVSNDYLCKGWLYLLKTKVYKDNKNKDDYFQRAENEFNVATSILKNNKKANIYLALLKAYQGDMCYLKAEYAVAIEQYKKSIETYQAIWGPFPTNQIAEINSKLGDTYSLLPEPDHQRAFDAYNKAMNIKTLFSSNYNDYKVKKLTEKMKSFSDKNLQVITFDIQGIARFLNDLKQKLSNNSLTPFDIGTFLKLDFKEIEKNFEEITKFIDELSLELTANSLSLSKVKPLLQKLLNIDFKFIDSIKELLLDFDPLIQKIDVSPIRDDINSLKDRILKISKMFSEPTDDCKSYKTADILQYEGDKKSHMTILESRQNARRDRLHDEETVKRKLTSRMPTNFQLGAAIGRGDCFFDAMAQSLNALKGSKEYTVKSLRLLCDDYIKSEKHTWVKETIKADRTNYEQYLVRIRFTIEELEEEEKANTGLKLEDIVWGRPEIEGRMICEITRVKLHVIGVLEKPIHGIDVTEQLIDAQALEPVTTIEKGQYDSSDIIHLINHHNHFVPLLDGKIFQIEEPLAKSTEYSQNDNYNWENIPYTGINIVKKFLLFNNARTQSSLFCVNKAWNSLSPQRNQTMAKLQQK